MLTNYNPHITRHDEECLFYALDTNKDGLIDVNELGNNLYPHYRPDDGSDDAVIWNSISNRNSIPVEDFARKMADLLHLPPYEIHKIMSEINIEGTPHISYWQYLRSRDFQGGQKFANAVHNSGVLFSRCTN